MPFDAFYVSMLTENAHEALVYFPVGNGDRYTGLVQRVGEEGTQQFHDLRVQEERVRKGIRD